jgi:hypothetical protein
MGVFYKLDVVKVNVYFEMANHTCLQMWERDVLQTCKQGGC